MTSPKSSLIAALLLAGVGCGTGGLEQAQFTGECAGELGCAGELDRGPLAVGASVEIRPTFDVPGSGLPSISMLAVEESVLSVAGDTLTGVAPGMSAVLLTDDAGIVLDFYHVFVELPDHLQVTRIGGETTGADLDGPIELLVGDEMVLTTRPSLDSQLLAGSAPSQWTSSGPAISVLRDGDPSRRRLVAREVGTATIEIESMGLSRLVTLNVLP